MSERNRIDWDDSIARSLGGFEGSHGDRFKRHEFVECDACRAKPGAPNLCYGCLANRTTVGDLRAALAEALDGWELAARWAMTPDGAMDPVRLERVKPDIRARIAALREKHLGERLCPHANAYDCAYCNERRCMKCDEPCPQTESVKTAVRWCPTHREDGRMGKLDTYRGP